MTTLHADILFAPLDADLQLERIGGGNETEVYSSDDRRFVVKVNSEVSGEPGEMLREAQSRRTTAEVFAAAVGVEHSIPTYYLISRSSVGQAQLVTVQPYLRQALPLAQVDYTRLNASERHQLAAQLRQLISRAKVCYRQTGQMPDLFGRTNRSQSDRKRSNAPHMLPWRMWHFLVRRTLLRSHNLMLTDSASFPVGDSASAQRPVGDTPTRRLILVDYDPVRRSRLYQFFYYTARRVLFWRDYLFIWLMENFGYVPRG